MPTASATLVRSALGLLLAALAACSDLRSDPPTTADARPAPAKDAAAAADKPAASDAPAAADAPVAIGPIDASPLPDGPAIADAPATAPTDSGTMAGADLPPVGPTPCPMGHLRCFEQCLPPIANASVCCSAGDCPARDDATPSCEGNRCAYACTGETVDCEGACIGLDKPTCCGADKALDVDGNGVGDCQENMVVNGQFARDLFGWRAEPGSGDARLEWSPMDGRGASGSGSVKVTNIYKDYPFSRTGAGFKRVVPLEGGVTYYVHADYFIPAGQTTTGSASIELDADNSGFYQTVELGRQVGVWTRAKVMVKVLSPDRDSLFRLDAVKDNTIEPFVVHFDNVLLRR